MEIRVVSAQVFNKSENYLKTFEPDFPSIISVICGQLATQTFTQGAMTFVVKVRKKGLRRYLANFPVLFQLFKLKLPT